MSVFSAGVELLLDAVVNIQPHIHMLLKMHDMVLAFAYVTWFLEEYLHYSDGFQSNAFQTGGVHIDKASSE